MATNITVNGTVYSVPAAGETGWASSVSTYLIAVGSAFLSKSGGSFTLTANANFGATYGLISKYFTSYSSNPSTTGVIRLANNEGIGFRNAANGADLILKVNASNILEYNGNPITTLALGTADFVLRMNSAGTASEYAKLVDANIASGAAIAVNKLAALTASKAAATDASGFVSAATTSLTELNYLAGVTTPTGTGALVLATSPSLTTPSLGVATATSINSTTIPSSKTLVVTTDKLSVHAATTSAELAGVISDETGSGLLVFGTSPNITTPTGIVKGDVGLGNVDNTSDATKDAATTTLTNKSLTNPNINTQATVKAAGELRFNNAGDTFYTGFKGGNAAANKIFTLPTTDGAPSQVLKTDGNGNLSWGEASGGGVRNYISNASFEDTTITGWSAYADAAGTTPVDGTGGSPTSTVAYSSTTPLRQNGSMLFTKPASNRQGEGISYAFTIDLQDTGKPVTVSFDASMSSGYTGSSGTENLVVYIYDVTNATLITPCQINIAPGVSSFNCFFIASTSVSYRLIIHAATTGTVAYTAKFDNFYCGPQSVIQGAAVTDWQSYTIAITGVSSNPTKGTIVVDSAWWRRVGDSVEIHYEFQQSAAGSAGSGNYKFSLPSGLVADSTKIRIVGINPEISNIGTGSYQSTTVTIRALVATMYDNLTFNLQDATGASIIGSSHAPLSDASVRWSANIKVPIVGWSSSVTMANRSVEEYSYNSGAWDTDDSTTFGYGLAGGTMIGGLTAGGRTKRVRFTTPAQANDHIELLVTDGTTYLPALQFADTSNNRIVNGKMADGTNVGFLVKRVSGSTTDFDVFFHQYAASANDDSPAQNWINGWKWLLKKTSGGASVGFPVSARNIVGDVSGTTVPSGYIGEKISVTLTPTAVSGSYTDVSPSLTLPKGIWMIYAAFTMAKTANSTAYCIFKLRDTTTPTDMYSYSWGTQSTATALFTPHTIAVYVNQSITKSYVLQAYDPNNTSVVTFASNTGGVYGQQEFFAVRIA